MNLAKDITSLSNFKRETTKLIKRMKKTKNPVVLTINGEAALVVQDVESYQALLDAKERMDALEGIRRGLESMKAGKGKPLAQFLADFSKQYGFDVEE